jgi:hypothetical protein
VQQGYGEAFPLAYLEDSNQPLVKLQRHDTSTQRRVDRFPIRLSEQAMLKSCPFLFLSYFLTASPLTLLRPALHSQARTETLYKSYPSPSPSLLPSTPYIKAQQPPQCGALPGAVSDITPTLDVLSHVIVETSMSSIVLIELLSCT